MSLTETGTGKADTVLQEYSLHIACAADAAYLPHCAAMLHSIFQLHKQHDLNVHFLHGPELPVEQVRPLADMVSGLGGRFFLHFIPADWVEGLPRLSRIPAVMWYRIYLPQLLPDQSRVLYLDCDTLVVDDLLPLWTTSLDQKYVAAVANVMESQLRNWPQTLGLPEGTRYFNSGVLLMNLDTMRRDGVTAQLAAIGREQSARLRWPDQDALNAILGHRCQFLHPRWNCQNSFFYYPQSREVFGKEAVGEATSRPGILHFEGGHIVKPWHYLSKHPYRRVYLQHRKGTPWPRVQLQERTLFNVLLRLLPTTGAIRVLKLLYRLRAKLSVHS